MKGELMKKKHILITCILSVLLLFTACGQSDGPELYNGHDSDYWEQMCKSLVVEVESMTPDEMQQYYDGLAQTKNDETAKIMHEMLGNWIEYRPVLGEIQDFKDFKIEKTGKTITATLGLDYSKRDANFVYVMSTVSQDVTAINLQPQYTLGETMKKAGMNTIMGISIVFCMLAIMSVIIYCFKFISVLEEKAKNKGNKAEDKGAAVTAAVSEANAVSTDDTELIAVIAAAIAAATGTSADDFVVRSIKRRF